MKSTGLTTLLFALLYSSITLADEALTLECNIKSQSWHTANGKTDIDEHSNTLQISFGINNIALLQYRNTDTQPQKFAVITTASNYALKIIDPISSNSFYYNISIDRNSGNLLSEQFIQDTSSTILDRGKGSCHKISNHTLF